MHVCVCMRACAYVCVVMKKQLDRIDKNAEMLMGKKEISSSTKQQLQTAVKVC